MGEVGVSELRGIAGNICKAIHIYDVNSLYLSCYAEDFPTGLFMRRRAKNDFKIETVGQEGYMAQEWLYVEGQDNNVDIQHSFFKGEKKLFYNNAWKAVDGYYEVPLGGGGVVGVVMEYLGCYTHACEKCDVVRDESLKTKRRTKTAQFRTWVREQTQIVNGAEVPKYIYQEMWDHDWLRQRDMFRFMLEHDFYHPMHFEKLDEKTILANILNGKLFGFLRCDIRTPESYKEHFSEFQPIFKNIDLSLDNCGSQYMQEFAREMNVKSTPQKTTIASYFGDDQLISTPLLVWYLQHGLEVTHISELIQFRRSKCFDAFKNKVANARREGDRNPDSALVANLFKTLGNTSYGKWITRIADFNTIKLVNARGLDKMVTRPNFKTAVQISDDCFEITMQKERVSGRIANYLACFTYSLAKRAMLAFYYDFIDYYVDRKDYCYVLMDTDSAGIMLTGENIDDLVRHGLREKYAKDKHNWLPRTGQHAAWDRRTPGLMKLEMNVLKFVALNSKCYYLVGVGQDKCASKGVQAANHMAFNDFLTVLNTKQHHKIVNRGFVKKNLSTYTYKLNKIGLNYLYLKRPCDITGLHTTACLL
jgi:hypothetical protein